MIRSFALIAALSVIAYVPAARSTSQQHVPAVTVPVTVTSHGSGTTAPSPADVVAWLTPEDDAVTVTPGKFKIIQQNKRFTPHLLVVPVGSTVEFPNLDPYFHNAFSLFNGRRFDLGLYESGATRGATFSKPGVSFIFCNIHPEMTAVVISVDTPYYATSTRAGSIVLKDVPAGRYTLSVWHERYEPARPAGYPRAVTVSAETRSLEPVVLVDTGDVMSAHKNKYGQDYKPPASGPVYRGAGS